MMMLLLQYAIGFLAISQLFFLALSYLVHFRRQVLSTLVALYSFCLISYIILTLPEVQSGPLVVEQFFRAWAVATPVLFWAVTRHLFVEESVVPPWVWLLLGIYTSFRLIGMTLSHEGALGAAEYFIFMLVPQTIMLGFGFHAIYTALRGASADLVEPRRKLRVPFVVAMGMIIIVIVCSGFFGGVGPALRSSYYLLIFLATVSFNLIIFRLHRDTVQLLRPSSGRVQTEALSRSEKALIERIQQVLEEERLYAKTGLTIGELAEKVSTQEYLLRRFINQKLNYRNFNQFLNEYRIAKASDLLQSPNDRKPSISTVALDVGYSSLSCFNRAFKEVHGVTPSLFRQRVS